MSTPECDEINVYECTCREEECVCEGEEYVYDGCEVDEYYCVEGEDPDELIRCTNEERKEFCFEFVTIGALAMVCLVAMQFFGAVTVRNQGGEL